LNIPFPPSKIFLSLFVREPLRSLKSSKDGVLFPAKNKRAGGTRLRRYKLSEGNTIYDVDSRELEMVSILGNEILDLPPY
jgi:metallophosphoesterase superfamily enzyme